MICTFEDGGQSKNLRHVSATAVAIKNGQILLTKRAPNLHLYPNTWVNPGGFLDRDETTAEGAIRELREETGYDGTIIKLLRANDDPHRPDGTRQTVDFVYWVEVGEKKGVSDNESVEVKWFDLDKLPNEAEFGFDHFESIKLYLKASSPSC